MYDSLLILSVVVFVGVAIAYLRLPCATFFHPGTIYLAFHGFIFVFRPIVARILDFQLIYRVYDFYPSMADKITVILAANLGFLVFMAVVVRVAPQPVRFPVREFSDAARRQVLVPLLIVSALIAPPGVYALLSTWGSRSSDVTTMVRDAATGATINTTGIGWLTDLGLALVPLTVVFAWIFRFRPVALIPLGIYGILQLGTGTRGPLIYALVAVAMLYLYDRRRKWPEMRAALLLLVASVAFVTIVKDRGQSIRELFDTEQTTQSATAMPVKPLEHMDFGNLEYFEYLVYAVPQRTGSYDYFASNLQILTEPIPRRMWPGKPVGSPVKFFSLWDYGTPIGITASLPGMGWMELGYLGVVIQCAFFAFLYAMVHRKLLVERASRFTAISGIVIIAATVVVYRDGALLSAIRQLPFYLGPVLLTWLLARAIAGGARRKPDGAAAGYSAEQESIMVSASTPAERRAAMAALLPKT